MGVSESGVQDIFPNLANWNVSARDLGLFNT
jgi:hypothetical protein